MPNPKIRAEGRVKKGRAVHDATETYTQHAQVHAKAPDGGDWTEAKLANLEIDLDRIRQFFDRGLEAQRAVKAELTRQLGAEVARRVDAEVTSRAPLLSAKQAAHLIGAQASPLWVRRNVPGGVRLGPRRMAWPVEALERFTGLIYSDLALQAVGITPYPRGSE